MKLTRIIKNNKKKEFERNNDIVLDKVLEISRLSDRLNTELFDFLHDTDAEFSTIRLLTEHLNKKLSSLDKKEERFLQDFFVRKEEGDGGKALYKIYKK